MKNFYSPKDVTDTGKLLNLVRQIKEDPLQFAGIGNHKVLVLLFFNASLRTKLSTQRAAYNLGMQVISMDMKNSWAWEIEEGTVMRFDTAEHIKEAAGVIGQYADIIGIRSFAALVDRDRDERDELMGEFIRYCDRPVINLESTLRHPLQSLADVFTISENQQTKNPKIVLSWAPHPRALPQAVANSFLEWTRHAGYEVTVTHPPGYELSDEFMTGHHLEPDQDDAFKNADFVYVKNWSSYSNYGKVLIDDPSWMITHSKLQLTNRARLMHCLPVRRNVVLSDDALDSPYSIVQELAENRLYAAQAILFNMLQSIQTNE